MGDVFKVLIIYPCWHRCKDKLHRCFSCCAILIPGRISASFHSFTSLETTCQRTSKEIWLLAQHRELHTQNIPMEVLVFPSATHWVLCGAHQAVFLMTLTEPCFGISSMSLTRQPIATESHVFRTGNTCRWLHGCKGNHYKSKECLKWKHSNVLVSAQLKFSRLIPQTNFVLKSTIWAVWVFWDTTMHCSFSSNTQKVHSYLRSLSPKQLSSKKALQCTRNSGCSLQSGSWNIRKQMRVEVLSKLTHSSSGEKCVHWFNHPKCNNNDITPILQRPFHRSKILRLVQVIHTIIHRSFAIKIWLWCVCWFVLCWLGFSFFFNFQLTP